MKQVSLKLLIKDPLWGYAISVALFGLGIYFVEIIVIFAFFLISSIFIAYSEYTSHVFDISVIIITCMTYLANCILILTFDLWHYCRNRFLNNG